MEKTSCGKTEAEEQAYSELIHSYVEQLSTIELQDAAFETLYEDHRYATADQICELMGFTNNLSKKTKNLIRGHFNIPRPDMKQIRISDQTKSAHYIYIDDFIYEIPKKYPLQTLTQENFRDLLKPYQKSQSERVKTMFGMDKIKAAIEIEELEK